MKKRDIANIKQATMDEENAHWAGYIIRYSKGNCNCGYVYEPWHIPLYRRGC
ncbi:D-alanyl-D-alanine carboxypeptidase family protein [Bacillus pacificus]